MPDSVLPQASRKHTPARVLIVDDDPAIRLICAASIEDHGHVVTEAADGQRALAQVRAERPDLVLTDVTMPRLDGFELAEALRGDAATIAIPLIFLSGETTAQNRARAEALGALAYITKPFDPGALASIVSEALSRARFTTTA